MPENSKSPNPEAGCLGGEKQLPGHQESGQLLGGDQVAGHQNKGQEELQKTTTVEPSVQVHNQNEEMYLADEARWENMNNEQKTTNYEVDNKLIELNDKYLRLLKAKEASDIRVIELHDKNAELVTRNTSNTAEITKLKEDLKKERELKKMQGLMK